ncbi:hypothetical protein BH09BAC1_BH09BAC1_18060 [soil metagenome]
MKYCFTLILLTVSIHAFSQSGSVGVNTSAPDPSASLEVGTTNKGLLIPMVSLTGATDITTVVGAPYPTRLLVYNQATAGTAPNNVWPGYYYWTGSAWIRMKVGAEGEDHDWYEQGGTSAPNNINDNIYTHGNVGIGIATPGQKLHVVGTTRISTLASGASGALVRTNTNGDMTITNFTGSAGDVLLGNGSFGSGTSFADNLGNHVATTVLNMNSNDISNLRYGNILAGDGYGVRFWQSDFYKIHMGNAAEYHYGPVTDYSIKMNMNNTAGRGWTWGIAGSTPVAGLSNTGHFQIEGDLTVVGGDIDMVKGLNTRIHRLGEISFDWTSAGSYDTPEYHGIQSKNEAGSWSDNLRINSFNDIITTLDANNNDVNSYFKIQEHSTADGADMFWVRSSDGYAYHKGKVGIGTTTPRADTELDVVGAIGTSRLGMGGTYNSTEVQGIWTIAPNYKISTANNDFGAQYGITYAHTNAGTGGVRQPIAGWGHQILFTNNGIRNVVLSLDGHGYFAGNMGIGTTAPSERLHVTSNILADGIVYWGNSGTRTESRSDAGLQGNAGAKSGFYETSAPAPSANWPTGASSWWHLLDVRHSNNGNNYAMQIAGSFFDQSLYYRKTNNNPAQPWTKIVSGNQGATAYSNATEIALASNNTGTYSTGAGVGWTPGTWQAVSGFTVTRNVTSGGTVNITVNALVEGDNYNSYVPSCAYFRLMRGGVEVARSAVMMSIANYVPSNFWFFNSNDLSMNVIETGLSGNQTYTVEYWLPNEFSATEGVRLGFRSMNVIELGN